MGPSQSTPEELEYSLRRYPFIYLPPRLEERFPTAPMDFAQAEPKQLPHVIVLEIVLKIPVTGFKMETVARVSQVCKAWYTISWCNEAWTRFFTNLQTRTPSNLPAKTRCFQSHKESKKLIVIPDSWWDKGLDRGYQILPKKNSFIRTACQGESLVETRVVEELHTLVVGASRVGKSKIVLAEPGYTRTHDGEVNKFYKFIFPLGKMHVQEVMDFFGGLETRRNIFIQEYNLFIVVYSVTSEETLDFARRAVKTIRQVGMEVEGQERPVILVGNKIDLVEKRVVSRDQGIAVAKELGVGWMEICAEKGEGLEELVHLIHEFGLFWLTEHVPSKPSHKKKKEKPVIQKKKEPPSKIIFLN